MIRLSADDQQLAFWVVFNGEPQLGVSQMTSEEFAEAIAAVLAKADDARMSIEEQIEILEDMTEAMREAIGQRRTS